MKRIIGDPPPAAAMGGLSVLISRADGCKVSMFLSSRWRYAEAFAGYASDMPTYGCMARVIYDFCAPDAIL